MKRKAPPTLMPKSKKMPAKTVDLSPATEPAAASKPAAKPKPKPKAVAEKKVRFNLSIRESIYREIKRHAAYEGISAGRYIENLVSADQKLKR